MQPPHTVNLIIQEKLKKVWYVAFVRLHRLLKNFSFLLPIGKNNRSCINNALKKYKIYPNIYCSLGDFKRRLYSPPTLSLFWTDQLDCETKLVQKPVHLLGTRTWKSFPQIPPIHQQKPRHMKSITDIRIRV
jgi:hypothetical protein